MKQNKTIYTGCKPPKIDLRDYKLNSNIVSNTQYELPDEYHIPHYPKVKNQENVSSCVAHATSSILEYYTNNIDLSTNFIYGIQSYLFNRKDKGMYLSDACKIVQQYGNMLEKDCKGNTEIPECYTIAEEAFNTESKLKKAYEFRIDSYFNCSTTNEIKYAIYKYGPVLGSLRWLLEWEVDTKTSILYNDSDNETKVGYHAIMIVGWTKDGFICQNSWGKNWGKNGRFIVPYSVNIEEAKGIKDFDNNPEDIIKPNKKDNKIINLILKILNYIINLLTRNQ